jgi:hypothetical protein
MEENKHPHGLHRDERRGRLGGRKVRHRPALICLVSMAPLFGLFRITWRAMAP